MWDRYTGRSFGDLYALGTPLIHLPRYPAYGVNEARTGDYDYFYLRSPRYRSCQASRFLLFGGSFITLADRAALDLKSDVSGYWSGFYREYFPDGGGDVARYDGETGYRAFIGQNPAFRVLTPHPKLSPRRPARGLGRVLRRAVHGPANRAP